MPENFHGPYWAVKLRSPGKEHPEFLGAESDGMNFIWFFGSEQLATVAIADNGHGTPEVVKLSSREDIGTVLLNALNAGLPYVGIDNGPNKLIVYPIPHVLKMLGS